MFVIVAPGYLRGSSLEHEIRLIGIDSHDAKATYMCPTGLVRIAMSVVWADLQSEGSSLLPRQSFEIRCALSIRMSM